MEGSKQLQDYIKPTLAEDVYVDILEVARSYLERGIDHDTLAEAFTEIFWRIAYADK